MANSRYKNYTIQKKSDVSSVVRKSFITRAQYEFEGGGAITSGTLQLVNIMGEEDVYRWNPDIEERADNPLTARIIWSSGAKANSKVYYSAESEAFDLESTVENTPVAANGVYYHEVFLTDLDIDTEYAFQVESYDANGNSLRSDTYWFHTHGQILVTSELDVAVSLLARDIDKTLAVSMDIMDSSPELVTNIFSGDVAADVIVASAITLDHQESFTSDEDEFFTDVQTTVV
jgi:hypothetical protein